MHLVRPFRTGLAGAAAGALALTVLPLTAAGADTAAACAAAPLEVDFDDVDEAADTFGEPIACVAGYDLVDGFPDNTFRPSNEVTRAQAAKFLTGLVETARARGLPVPAENPFGDVDDEGLFARVILKLHEAGIIDGRTADTFDPSGTLSRGEMAKIVANALEFIGVELTDPDGSAFDDVPEGGTFEPFIDKLADAGIVEGDGTGSYDPAGPVRRGQLGKFVANGAGAADAANLWDPTDPEGPVPTADPASALAGDEIEVTVTVRDANGDVVAGAFFDAFVVDGDDNFNDDGSPRYAAGATVDEGGLAPPDNSTGLAQAQIDPNDPTTGVDGTATLLVASEIAQDADLVVWTGAQGDGFANADVAADARGHTVLRWETVPTAVDVIADRTSRVYAYGEDPELAATLVDDDDNPVAFEGETLGYVVTEAGNPITGPEVVASGEATTDASGTVVFGYTAPTDPDVDADDSTTQTVTVFWDRDGDGEQGEDETADGSIELTFDDDDSSAE